ncbi:hypothetical protein FN846DRAFT_912775 [Sphaerosporella brunnea]|uniref:Uncharacterized protein n=1 Tax=Sphaerosporella brunnea TaxID=1250544 RepID=A0A5J5EH63_9PEZI|nr:hypothetical protein FN846DRAFT_912775 [Sphaerosporella brunnea]
MDATKLDAQLHSLRLPNFDGAHAYYKKFLRLQGMLKAVGHHVSDDTIAYLMLRRLPQDDPWLQFKQNMRTIFRGHITPQKLIECFESFEGDVHDHQGLSEDAALFIKRGNGYGGRRRDGKGHRSNQQGSHGYSAEVRRKDGKGPITFLRCYGRGHRAAHCRVSINEIQKFNKKSDTTWRSGWEGKPEQGNEPNVCLAQESSTDEEDSEENTFITNSRSPAPHDDADDENYSEDKDE